MTREFFKFAAAYGRMSLSEKALQSVASDHRQPGAPDHQLTVVAHDQMLALSAARDIPGYLRP